MRAIVCVKQVADPLAPATSFRVVGEGPDLVAESRYQPVVNGFDEQALEAALRIRDALGALEIVALSVGPDLRPDIIKRTLGGLVDDLVLVHQDDTSPWDSHNVAQNLAAAIRLLGGADLVLCGRQSSDWNAALVPLLLAEELDLPCLPLARSVTVEGNRVHVESLADDGVLELWSELPALVSVTSELGELRFPSTREKLAAARKQPRSLSATDLPARVENISAVRVEGLEIPDMGGDCEYLDAGGGEATGRALARLLIQQGLVASSKGGG